MDKSKEKLKGKDFITLGISLIAITLSVSSFYFQYFRENHSLKVSASANLEDWASKNTLIIIRGVLINYGNRTEVLYSGKIKFEHRYDNLTLAPSIGPIVLKPGEATSFEMKDSISFAVEEVGYKSSNQDSIYLTPQIEFVTVSPNGQDKYSKYLFDTYCYFEPSDNWSSVGDKTKKTKWMELLK